MGFTAEQSSINGCSAPKVVKPPTMGLIDFLSAQPPRFVTPGALFSLGAPPGQVCHPKFLFLAIFRRTHHSQTRKPKVRLHPDYSLSSEPRPFRVRIQLWLATAAFLTPTPVLGWQPKVRLHPDFSLSTEPRPIRVRIQLWLATPAFFLPKNEYAPHLRSCNCGVSGGDRPLGWSIALVGQTPGRARAVLAGRRIFQLTVLGAN